MHVAILVVCIQNYCKIIEFIAMKPVERCTADMLVQVIKVRLRYITSY